MVIAARIINCNLKVDWKIQNKFESKIEVNGNGWGIWPVNFVQGRGYFEYQLRFEMAEGVEFDISWPEIFEINRQ